MDPVRTRPVVDRTLGERRQGQKNWANGFFFYRDRNSISFLMCVEHHGGR